LKKALEPTQPSSAALLGSGAFFLARLDCQRVLRVARTKDAQLGFPFSNLSFKFSRFFLFCFVFLLKKGYYRVRGLTRQTQF
jgi:hypothetical protein